MTKAPQDHDKSSREARLQRALRENLMRRKEQTRARRVTQEAQSLDERQEKAGESVAQGRDRPKQSDPGPGASPDEAAKR